MPALNFWKIEISKECSCNCYIFKTKSSISITLGIFFRTRSQWNWARAINWKLFFVEFWQKILHNQNHRKVLKTLFHLIFEKGFFLTFGLIASIRPSIERYTRADLDLNQRNFNSIFSWTSFHSEIFIKTWLQLIGLDNHFYTSLWLHSLDLPSPLNRSFYN